MYFFFFFNPSCYLNHIGCPWMCSWAVRYGESCFRSSLTPCSRVVAILLGHLLARSPSTSFFIDSAAWPTRAGLQHCAGLGQSHFVFTQPSGESQWIAPLLRGNSVLEMRSFGPELHSKPVFFQPEFYMNPFGYYSL